MKKETKGETNLNNNTFCKDVSNYRTCTHSSEDHTERLFPISQNSRKLLPYVIYNVKNAV